MNYSPDHRLVKSGTHVTRFVFMSENNQSIKAFSVDSLFGLTLPNLFMHRLLNNEINKNGKQNWMSCAADNIILLTK